MFGPLFIAVIAILHYQPSIAHHDPHCNPALNVQVCVAHEMDRGRRILRCVESREDRPLSTDVVWHKNGVIHMESTRVHKEGAGDRLVFEQLLVSDEGNWTCSNGSLSPPFKLYAGKVNITQQFASLNHSIGDNFTVPCNIEVGVNTAQTSYTLSIYRNIFYDDRNTTFLLLHYRHNTGPDVVTKNSTAMDPTSYTFYSSNLTLYVENFSVPSPQHVRGVKFVCEFYIIIQGEPITAETTTAVIPGFYPPKITASLDTVAVLPQGSNHTFMVQVYSHPPSHVHWWRLNGREISASDPHFVLDGPHISGNTSDFSLTILNASERYSGILQFEARLGNLTSSTETTLIIPLQVQKVEIANSCEDVAYEDGPLNFKLLSNFPVALSQDQFSDFLQIQLKLNWSLIPDSLNQTVDWNITEVYISNTQWNGSVCVDIERAHAVPQNVMNGLKTGKRFRVQTKLIFNGVAAAEWSPICESPIFQPCVQMTSAEIKLKLMFSSEDQCSLYPADKVKRAIEDFLRRKFSCDNITVSSANEYSCNQDSRMSFLRANVTTYYASSRVEKFYYYLRNENVILFDGAVEVREDDGIITPAPRSDHDNNMVYIFVSIVVTILLFCVIAIFIITIVLVVKKFRKMVIKPKDPESKKGDNRPGSFASTSRSQNFYVEDPMSPTSLSSSVQLARSPNHAHNHAPRDTHTPPHSSNSTHIPRDNNPQYPEEAVSQANLYHEVINLEDLANGNSAGLPLQPCVLNQELSSGANETSVFLSDSEQEFIGNQWSRVKSSAFGDDVSLNEFDPREYCRLGGTESTSSGDNVNYCCQHKQDYDEVSEVQTAPEGCVHQSAFYNEAKKTAQVPFLDHEILECDCNGREYTNMEHDITLRIPKGAVPVNKKIHFEVGVAMYGPFNFPKNTQPISPILWLCILEEDVELTKPFQIILPHFLNELTEERLLYHQVGFAKASHNNFTFRNSRQMYYIFSPCDIKPQFISSVCRDYGVLSLNHCCFYCILAKQTQELAMDAGYCLVRIEASLTSYRNEIIFSAIYFLDTCLKSLEEQFPQKNEYEITCYRDFKFKEDETEPYLKVIVPSERNEHYVIGMEPSAAKIRITDIEFWKRGFNDMRRRHERKMYPPRIKMTVSMRNPEFTLTLPVKFEGCTDNSQLNVDLTIPFDSSRLSSGSSSRSSSLSSSSQQGSHSQPRQSPSGDTPKLQDVFRAVLGLASYWKTIGTLLGLKSHLLDNIKSEEEGAHDRLQKMLSEWLKQVDPPPTWKDIGDAVETVDANKAQEIRKRCIESDIL